MSIGMDEKITMSLLEFLCFTCAAYKAPPLEQISMMMLLEELKQLATDEELAECHKSVGSKADKFDEALKKLKDAKKVTPTPTNLN